MLDSSAVDHGRVKPKTGICCIFAKHVALKRKIDWLARNQDYVSEWCDSSTTYRLSGVTVLPTG
jgi:hypothetical protein